MTTPLADAPWLKAKESRRLMDVLTSGNVPARFVGGCVRDGLLGQFTHDVDLDVTTPLLPDQVIERLEATDIKVIPTGLAHGTVTALVRGQAFEITTLRKDIACDGRHAEVQFTDDFEEDAARRDFTINALSVDRDGRLFDYFGGQEDLQVGKIRFVGEAKTRVGEDFLRILRFFRFFARYGQPPADQEALEACREGADGLSRISGERIRAEMLKLLASDDPIAALALMIENKVLQQILPARIDLAPLKRLLAAAADSDPLLRLAAMLRSDTEPKSTLAAAAAWKFSNAEMARLERLAQMPDLPLPLSKRDAKQTLYRLGEETYLDLLKLSAETPEALEAALPTPKIPSFPLTGQDLINRGVVPGPDLGKRLKQLEAWWLDNDLEPDRKTTLQELDRRLANP